MLIGPRLVELCFQTVGLVEAGTDGVLALPLHVGAVRLNGRPEERAALVAIVRRDGHGGFDCIVRDDDGSLFCGSMGTARCRCRTRRPSTSWPRSAMS